jgi:hypothetical protein
MTEESELQEHIRSLIRRDLGKETASFERLKGGRNSRVVRVDCHDGSIFAVKAYFQSPHDPRDRMGCEYRALTLLKKEGLHQVAAPLCNDWEQKIAVYEFVKGDPAHGEGIRNGEIDQAVAFLAALRKLATPEKARNFGAASEACFSIRAILQNVEERFERLEKAALQKPSLASFLERDLPPFRAEVSVWLERFCQEKGMPMDQEIPASARTLSPSDFGFHNALKLPDGSLVFLDFEYFGWDDPAKTISDFLLHPGMELSHESRQRFFAGMMNAFADLRGLADRVRAVYPLFGLKWCAILLNEFTREHNERRIFAAGSVDSPQESIQLEKAKRMLGIISRDLHAFPFHP